MNAVTVADGEFGVNAAIVAEGLGLDPEFVLAAMRERKITSLCERGIDEDAGRSRLTFRYRERRFRLVIDQDGNILDRSVEG